MQIVVPALIAFIILYAILKDVDVIEAFCEGAKNGAKTVYKILFILVIMLCAIEMFKASGGLDAIVYAIKPVCEFLGVKSELVPLFIMRPISGGASISLLSGMLATYGADSYIGRVSSVACASSETSIYTIGVYMGSAGVKKTRYTLPLALLCDLITYTISIIIVNIFF